jgi:hypothetical protein
MDLIVDVYLNHSKSKALPSTKIGNGLITVADIISVEQQDFKCILSNIEWFIYRHSYNKSIVIDMVKSYFLQDFKAVLEKIQLMKECCIKTRDLCLKSIEQEKKEINSDATQLNQLCKDELEVLNMFITFMKENKEKINKYNLRNISINYVNWKQAVAYCEKFVVEIALKAQKDFEKIRLNADSSKNNTDKNNTDKNNTNKNNTNNTNNTEEGIKPNLEKKDVSVKALADKGNFESEL